MKNDKAILSLESITFFDHSVICNPCRPEGDYISKVTKNYKSRIPVKDKDYDSFRIDIVSPRNGLDSEKEDQLVLKEEEFFSLDFYLYDRITQWHNKIHPFKLTSSISFREINSKKKEVISIYNQDRSSSNWGLTHKIDKKYDTENKDFYTLLIHYLLPSFKLKERDINVIKIVTGLINLERDCADFFSHRTAWERF